MVIGFLILLVILFFFISIPTTTEQVKPVKEQTAWEREREKAERAQNKAQKKAAERENERLREIAQINKWREWAEREVKLKEKRHRITVRATTQSGWEARKKALLSLNESTYEKLQQDIDYDTRIGEAESEVRRINELYSEASSEYFSAPLHGFGWKSARAEAQAKKEQIEQQLEDAKEHLEELKKAKRNAYDCVDITFDEIQALILGTLEKYRHQLTESEIVAMVPYLTYLRREEDVFRNENPLRLSSLEPFFSICHWRGLTAAFEQLKQDGMIIDTRIFPRDSQKPPTYQLTDKVPTGERIERAVFASMADVDKMDGRKFEQFCADLLRKVGFHSVEVTKGSGDQGVDIIAVQGGKRYAIQCKRYSSRLGNKPVQEVHAGKDMYNCQVGAVLTNQYFTSGAQELAESTGVLLWDRDELERLIKMANN